MDFIFSIPYFVRVLLSLFIILIINRLLKQLSLSVLVGVIVLALWTGQSFQSIISITWTRISSANFIFLIVIIFQVIWLSTQMSKTGVMKELVEAVRSRVTQRVSMALLPAVIGFLPMPGGAIFSAPMLDDCDRENTIEPILKTKINYWFRHIWEYWWPLYPGVLLAIDITGLSVMQFMLLQFPMSIISVIAGYIFLLRKVHPSQQDNVTGPKYRFKDFILLILPIIVIIICYVLIKILLPDIALINKYIPIMFGILIAQIVLQIQKPLNTDSWKKIFFSSQTLSMTLIVSVILVYGAFIGAQLPDGSLLMTHMRTELASLGIPIFFIIMLIPFISGITTGVAVGFVGASLPIVMSLISDNPSMNELLSTTVLAYVSGYMGIILSPVHVCLIVTNEHFKTNLFSSIIRLIKPASFVLISAIILYFIIR